MLEIFNRNDTYLVGGKIKNIKPGTGAAEGKLAVVELTANNWNPETKTNDEITFTVDCWNNEENQLAEKVLKIKHGTYITFLCRKKEDNAYIGQRMKTKGIWNFPQENEQPERNVLVGLITRVTESKNPGQYTQVTMPVSVFKKVGDGYEQETVWSDVRFWDNEHSGGRNDAKNAKIMTPNESGKKMVILICSKNIADETRKNPLYNGVRFEVL